MDIRLIALDMDMTTLNAESKLSEGNREALSHAIAKGVHIVIASGRAFSALPADVLAIPGIEYAITSNGAAVYHIPTGRRIHNFLLPQESVFGILDKTKGMDICYEAFMEGKAHADHRYVADPVAHGASEKIIPYILQTRTPEEDIETFIRAHSRNLDCIDIIAKTVETREFIRNLIKEEVSGVYVTSSARCLVEIASEYAGKHAGLRYLTEYLGIDRNETAAFGDADNDIEMLQYAGCGIAVANGSPDCLSVADYQTRQHNEDGVAYGIYEILKI